MMDEDTQVLHEQEQVLTPDTEGLQARYLTPFLAARFGADHY